MIVHLTVEGNSDDGRVSYPNVPSISLSPFNIRRRRVFNFNEKLSSAWMRS